MKRNLLIVSFLFLLCSMQCGQPYSAKIRCIDKKVNCYKIHFDSSLELTATNTWVVNISKKLNVFINCRLENPGNTQEILNRNSFSMISYKGLKFNLEMMQKEDQNGKTITLPNMYLVKSGTDEVYTFLFSSVNDFTNQEMINYLKKDSFLFFHNINTVDTLFKIVVTDTRIK